jgi:hypothetical protein
MKIENFSIIQNLKIGGNKTKKVSKFKLKLFGTHTHQYMKILVL